VALPQYDELVLSSGAIIADAATEASESFDWLLVIERSTSKPNFKVLSHNWANASLLPDIHELEPVPIRKHL